MKRMIYLLLAAVLTLSACSFPGKKKSNSEENVMIRLGDTIVEKSEVMVYLDATRTDYEQYYGDAIWNYVIDYDGGTLADVVKDQVLEEIIYVKTVCMQAESLGVTLSADELMKVDDQTDNYMKNSAPAGTNRDVVRHVYYDNMIARKIFEQATLNIDTNISNDEAGQRRFYTIALRNHKIGSDGTRMEYTEKEKEDFTEHLELVRKKAAETDNFLAYAKSVTEDSDMLNITVGKGVLSEKAETAAFALSAGEITPVIWDDEYCYIFYCVNTFDIDATLAKKEEMITKRRKEAFKAIYEAWKKDTVVTVNEEEMAKIRIGGE